MIAWHLTSSTKAVKPAAPRFRQHHTEAYDTIVKKTSKPRTYDALDSAISLQRHHHPLVNWRDDPTLHLTGGASQRNTSAFFPVQTFDTGGVVDLESYVTTGSRSKQAVTGGKPIHSRVSCNGAHANIRVRHPRRMSHPSEYRPLSAGFLPTIPTRKKAPIWVPLPTTGHISPVYHRFVICPRGGSQRTLLTFWCHRY